MSAFQVKTLITFISAKPETVLNKISEAGVILLNIHFADALTVEILIQSSDAKIVTYFLKKCNVEIKSVKEWGIHTWIKRALKRPILILGIVVFMLSVFYVPGRIYFVTISGSVTVPDNRILEVAENYGIRFASRSKDIRSEEIKNGILSALPELQWVGINTSGCVANIHVQERSAPIKPVNRKNKISGIVAAGDGTITEMTVHRGTPLVAVGQVVKKGDLLVSGYSDYGLKIVAQNAEAEIFGHTKRRNSFVAPVPTQHLSVFEDKHVYYRLRIGKKVINFCNHSGIPDAVCVKMYSEDYLSLPGGFQLPVSLTKITCLHYSQSEEIPDIGNVDEWLPAYAQKYILSQMVAGQILDENLQWYYSNDSCQLFGEYACHEMIGQMKYEEIMEHNAEDN